MRPVEKEALAPPRDEDAGPVGLFPGWTWVYAAVVAYGALMILGLWVLSRVLDPGVGP